MTRTLWAVLGLLSLPLALATTGDAATGGAATGGAMTGGTMAGGAAAVQVAESEDLGSFLVDERGMTLYLYTEDTPNTSNCYDDCAAAWPPLLTEGEPTAGEGVDAALLGTTERTDGTVQVTYNGWPLYYWVRDSAPGDTTGQDVGEVWYVVSPEGEAVTGE